MTKAELQEFSLWYEDNYKKDFIFKEESIRYCANDSLVLSLVMHAFREAVLEITDNYVDLFFCAFTTAGLSKTIFKCSDLMSKDAK